MVTECEDLNDQGVCGLFESARVCQRHTNYYHQRFHRHFHCRTALVLHLPWHSRHGWVGHSQPSSFRVWQFVVIIITLFIHHCLDQCHRFTLPWFPGEHVLATFSVHAVVDTYHNFRVFPYVLTNAQSFFLVFTDIIDNFVFDVPTLISYCTRGRKREWMKHVNFVAIFWCK